MSWNFPTNLHEFYESVKQYLNFLKCEIEQIKKHQLPTPDNLLGAPIGGPLAADLTELPFDPDPPGGDGGGGEAEKVVVLGKIQASSGKSSTATVPIQAWKKDPSNAAHIPDPSIGSFGAYPVLGSVTEGRWCICVKDIDTGSWYITGAECT